jgi:Fe2+ or Zn2+ uptake regulation protein
MGDVMARNEQLSRTIKIIMWLEASSVGLSIREIHAKLASDGHRSSVRTVYRDLEAIESAGVHLIHEQIDCDNKFIRYKLAGKEFFKQKNRLSDQEYLLILISEKTKMPILKSAFKDAVKKTLCFTKENLTKHELQYLLEIEKVVQIQSENFPQYEVAMNELESLLAACLNKVPTVWKGSEITPTKIIFKDDEMVVC